MRQVSGFRLWTGHVGDLRNPQPIIDAGILAVVDLRLRSRERTVTQSRLLPFSLD